MKNLIVNSHISLKDRPFLALFFLPLFIIACNTRPDGDTSDVSKATEEKPTIERSGHLKAGDGIKIFYEIHGAGEDTVVMVHGGPGLHAGVMVPDWERLEKNFTLIYYDQRGGGRSGRPDTTTVDQSLHIDRHIEDIEDLRKFFSLSKISLLGHSFGPMMVGRYALKYSDRVKKMVLVGPAPPYSEGLWERYEKKINTNLSPNEQQQMDSLWKLVVSGVDHPLPCREYWKIAMKPRLAADIPVEIVKGNNCYEDLAAFLYAMKYTNPTIFETLGDWDFREELREVQAPTLVIHGTEEAIPMDMAGEWVNNLPNGRLEKIENASHFPQLERPEVVWPLIEGFLKGDN